VILGALFAYLKLKVIEAIALVVGIALVFSLGGIASIALTSPLTPALTAGAIGAGLLIVFGILAILTYAGYHFAREVFRGRSGNLDVVGG
jgi:cytochrome c biogenesis protein CcdA